jgi:hypothetical protein
VYIPKGVRSPMELSTYFRINASETGQVGGRLWAGGWVGARAGARAAAAPNICTRLRATAPP